MQVDNLMVSDGPAAYYTDDLRNVMEDFMTILRTEASTQSVSVDPAEAIRFEADFYGLLTFLKVPSNFHFTIARVNKLNASTDYRSTMTAFLMPDQTELSRIMQTESTTNRASN